MLKLLRKMVVRSKEIPKPALHKGSRVAVYYLVGCGNVQTLHLGLRPVRNFLLQPGAVVENKRNIRNIRFSYNRFFCKSVGFRKKQPPAGTVLQRMIFVEPFVEILPVDSTGDGDKSLGFQLLVELADEIVSVGL